MSVNKVILVGFLGKDPESRFTNQGKAVCNLSVATTDSWKEKATGERKESTEWHRITSFDKLAEIMSQYLKKGSQVYIEGKLQTSKYNDKDGIERFQTVIIANTMQMIGSKNEAHEQPKNGSRTQNMRDSDLDVPL